MSKYDFVNLVIYAFATYLIAFRREIEGGAYDLYDLYFILYNNMMHE